MHRPLDLRGSTPVFIRITDATFADVRILDVLVPEPGSIYLFDRAFIDFRRLNESMGTHPILVTHTRENALPGSHLLRHLWHYGRHVNAPGRRHPWCHNESLFAA